MIQVNENLVDYECPLYLYDPAGICRGRIHNELQLNDVRLQIVREKVDGWSVGYENPDKPKEGLYFAYLHPDGSITNRLGGQEFEYPLKSKSLELCMAIIMEANLSEKR